MSTYRHWSVSLWRDPDDVSHCQILSPDKTEWRLISATLCGLGRCFVADQLWLLTRIREEDSTKAAPGYSQSSKLHIQATRNNTLQSLLAVMATAEFFASQYLKNGILLILSVIRTFDWYHFSWLTDWSIQASLTRTCWLSKCSTLPSSARTWACLTTHSD